LPKPFFFILINFGKKFRPIKWTPEVKDTELAVRGSGQQHLRVVVEEAGGHEGHGAGHAAGQAAAEIALQVRTRLDVVEHERAWCKKNMQQMNENAKF
jgi:hypothetical protein